MASVSGTTAAAMAAESAVSGGVRIMVRSEIGAVVAVALVVQLVEPYMYSIKMEGWDRFIMKIVYRIM